MPGQVMLFIVKMFLRPLRFAWRRIPWRLVRRNPLVLLAGVALIAVLVNPEGALLGLAAIGAIVGGTWWMTHRPPFANPPRTSNSGRRRRRWP